MFSAFAIADLSNFSIISEEAFGVNLTIARASETSFPLIKSATILTFLAEILAYLRVAFASTTAFSSVVNPPYLDFSLYYLEDLAPAAPLNVLVGANAPNLCPIISSVI